jgi:hypothetical protein
VVTKNAKRPAAAAIATVAGTVAGNAGSSSKTSKKISDRRRTRFVAGDRVGDRAGNSAAAFGLADCPDRVRSFPEWCDLNSISHDTGRRILASGKGPRVLQLSPHRIGIRDSDNRVWQDSIVRDSRHHTSTKRSQTAPNSAK